MFILFGLMAFASVVCMFVGFLMPRLFDRFSKKPMTRKRSFGIFGSVFVITFILFSITLPTQSTVNNQVSNDSPQAERVTYVTDEGSPEREIEKSVVALLGEKTNMGEQRVRNIDVFPSDASGQTHGVLIEFAADSNLTNGLTRRGIWTDTIEIIKKLSADQSIDSVTATAYILLVDQYGNDAPGKVMTVNLAKATWSKINWGNFITTNLPNVADLYWIHPAIAD